MTDHAETAISCFEAADELLDSGDQPTADLYVTSAQAHATLALVEVTERLAVAQETANLIARLAFTTSNQIATGAVAPAESQKLAGEEAIEVAKRLNGYYK